MARPKKSRIVEKYPKVSAFRPVGVRGKTVELGLDEFEALRLKDAEGVEQLKACKRMGSSQPTFHRLLLDARKKVSDAIVNGKVLKVQGGAYRLGNF